jgi:hypothetical protein
VTTGTRPRSSGAGVPAARLGLARAPSPPTPGVPGRAHSRSTSCSLARSSSSLPLRLSASLFSDASVSFSCSPSVAIFARGAAGREAQSACGERAARAAGRSWGGRDPERRPRPALRGDVMAAGLRPGPVPLPPGPRPWHPSPTRRPHSTPEKPGGGLCPFHPGGKLRLRDGA